jgi:EmrB/QacA subfamily drug resistance transporter
LSKLAPAAISESSVTAVESLAPPPFSHREILVILSGVLLGMLLASLDQTIVATALPAIARDLSGFDRISWVVSGYLVAATSTTPIYGKLSDLYGRRRVLQAAIVIFLVASALCGLARSMNQLIAFRVLQGLGGGGLISLAHATIADIVSPRERGRYQGYISGVFAGSSVAGPVLGGFISDQLSWHYVFWVNLPIGLIALVICDRTLRRLPRHEIRRRIDYPGALLLMAAISFTLLVTTLGGRQLAWTSPTLIALAAAGALSALSFVLVERRVPEPILPLRMFKNRVYALSSLMSFLTWMAMFGATVFLPLYLQLAKGSSASGSGLQLVPLTGGVVIGAFSSGRLVSKIGRLKPFPVVGMAVASAVLAILGLAGADLSAWTITGMMVLLGIGIGFVGPTAIVAVQNAVERRDLGAASASVSFFRSLGGSFGVALLSAVMLRSLDRGIGRIAGHESLGEHPALRLLDGPHGALSGLPTGLHAALLAAVNDAFANVFLWAAGFAALSFLAALALEELPLRSAP